MTEKPTQPIHLAVIQGKPNLAEANRLVGSLYRLVIKHDDVEKALREAGFSDEGLVSELNDFLYKGALAGTGQAEVDIQITTINRFRGLLEPFLPNTEEKQDSVRHGKVRSSGRTGKKDTGGAGFNPFD